MKKVPEVSEEDIRRVVRAFYTQVQKDELLAPIFATRIGAGEWEAHMEHIVDFWSSIFLKTGRFNGNPMRKHLGLETVTPSITKIPEKVRTPLRNLACLLLRNKIAFD